MVQISTDKEFKNIIDSKEIKDLKPYDEKTVVFDLTVNEELISERAKIYARIEADKDEITYFNNKDFTIIRGLDFYSVIIPTPEPTPTPTPEPTTEPTTEPTPTPTQEPTSKPTSEPTSSPTPTPTPETSPTWSATPKPGSVSGGGGNGGTSGGSGGNGSISGGGAGGGNNNVTETPAVVKPTPSPTEIPMPSPTEIPSSGEVGKFKAYIRGYEDNTFRPENSLTRAEMAVILANLAGAEKGETVNINYNDVSKGHWAAWAITYVSEKGYFKGYENNEFRPDRYITRAELAVVLCKYLNLDTVDVSDNRLTDIEGHWAQGFISRLVSDGYIKGYPDNTFKPDSNVKRSECVTLINRILKAQPLNDAETPFTDVDKGYWAFGDIMAAVFGTEK